MKASTMGRTSYTSPRSILSGSLNLGTRITCPSGQAAKPSWRAAARRLLIEHFFQLGIARMTRGQGFLIMPAREFEGRLRLGGINHRQIVVRAAVGGVELDRLAQRGFRRAALAFVAERDPEIILNFRALRIDLGRATQRVEGFVIFFLAESQVA